MWWNQFLIRDVWNSNSVEERLYNNSLMKLKFIHTIATNWYGLFASRDNDVFINISFLFYTCTPQLNVCAYSKKSIFMISFYGWRFFLLNYKYLVSLLFSHYIDLGNRNDFRLRNNHFLWLFFFISIMSHCEYDISAFIFYFLLKSQCGI